MKVKKSKCKLYIVKVKCTIDWYGRLISGKKEKESSFELFQRRVWSSPCSGSRGGGVLRIPVRRSRGRHHRLRQRLAHHCHGQTSGVLHAIYPIFVQTNGLFFARLPWAFSKLERTLWPWESWRHPTGHTTSLHLLKARLPSGETIILNAFIFATFLMGLNLIQLSQGNKS